MTLWDQAGFIFYLYEISSAGEYCGHCVPMMKLFPFTRAVDAVCVSLNESRAMLTLVFQFAHRCLSNEGLA